MSNKIVLQTLDKRLTACYYVRQKRKTYQTNPYTASTTATSHHTGHHNDYFINCQIRPS
jgi:hypothetical protein